MSKSLDELQPEFRAPLEAVVGKMAELGVEVVVYQTGRNALTQGALYLQGRHALRLVNTARKVAGLSPITEDSNKIVTNAKPGSSFHMYGLAADVAFRKGRKGVTWDGPWHTLGAVVRAVGLTWGGDFKTLKDRPHIQMSGYTISECRKRWPDGWPVPDMEEV